MKQQQIVYVSQQARADGSADMLPEFILIVLIVAAPTNWAIHLILAS